MNAAWDAAVEALHVRLPETSADADECDGCGGHVTAVLAAVAAAPGVRHAVVRAIADVPVNDVYAVADAVLRVIGGEP